MGSFNSSCGLSNLDIYYGQKVVGILITQSNAGDSETASQGGYSPVSLPFFGKYDSYGSIELNEDQKEVAKIIKRTLDEQCIPADEKELEYNDKIPHKEWFKLRDQHFASRVIANQKSNPELDDYLSKMVSFRDVEFSDGIMPGKKKLKLALFHEGAYEKAIELFKDNKKDIQSHQLYGDKRLTKISEMLEEVHHSFKSPMLKKIIYKLVLLGQMDSLPVFIKHPDPKEKPIFDLETKAIQGFLEKHGSRMDDFRTTKLIRFPSNMYSKYVDLAVDYLSNKNIEPSKNEKFQSIFNLIKENYYLAESMTILNKPLMPQLTSGQDMNIELQAKWNVDMLEFSRKTMVSRLKECDNTPSEIARITQKMDVTLEKMLLASSNSKKPKSKTL